MALRALTGLVPEWYTPEEERGANNAAEFYLTPLTRLQFIEVMSLCLPAPDGQVGVAMTYKARELALQYGLTDWKNVEDKDGGSLPFSRDNVGTIPGEILNELSGKIIEDASVLEADRKKSSLQLKSVDNENDSIAASASGAGTAT